MIRRLSALGVMAVVLAGAVLADDPPDRGKEKPFQLKRKKRGDQPPVKQPDDTDPDEPPVKAKGKGKVTPPERENPFKGKGKKGKKGPAEGKKGVDEPLEPEDGKEPQEDEQEVLERLADRMRSVEDKLSNREVGEPTVQEQEDIIKDLNKLINKKNQQNQQNQGGAQEQNQDQQDQQQQGGRQQEKGGMGQPKGGSRRMSKQQKSGSGQQKQTARRKKRQPRQLRGQRPGTQQAKAGNQSPMPKAGKAGTEPQPMGGAGNGTDTGDKLPDKKLYNDIWGHLPETLRAEMNAYSNPRPFMPRYDDLIKKYYRMIAEQGRKIGRVTPCGIAEPS